MHYLIYHQSLGHKIVNDIEYDEINTRVGDIQELKKGSERTCYKELEAIEEEFKLDSELNDYDAD